MNQLLPAPCAAGHICHRSWLGAELGSCPSRLFLSSMLLDMRALLQPGLQECSHCPTGWYISPRAAPTHFSSTPEATLPPAGLTMSAVAAATPGLCQLPSLNISSLFSTAATQPLTASGKGELTLQELILFLSLSPLQPLGEEETNNQEPVCRRPPQPYRLAMPICPMPEDFNFSQGKYKKQKTYRNLRTHLPLLLQVQGYFIHLLLLLQRCLYFIESRLIISKTSYWQHCISIIPFSLDIKSSKHITGFESSMQSVYLQIVCNI